MLYREQLHVTEAAYENLHNLAVQAEHCAFQAAVCPSHVPPVVPVK